MGAVAAPWREWIGREERRQDVVTPVPLAALAATLDRDDPPPRAGDAVPPLAHWLYFLPLAPTRDIGPDGHPKRGGFLPPVPLARRMWAGGRFQFLRPLRVGEAITRVSRIEDVSSKRGRSGDLAFVTVQHEIGGEYGPALIEQHDIVYRAVPPADTSAPPPVAAPTDAAFAREIVPDALLLFRFSALTFNGHRIHYDRAYATEVEGYPGLVVHGPLIATLLVDLLRRHQPRMQLESFRFKAVAPLFDGQPIAVCGRPDGARRFRLWACNREGALAMEAAATVAA